MKGGLDCTDEVAEVWECAKVSSAKLFMCVDLLRNVSEVNQTQNQPHAEVSWAKLFICVDVLDMLGKATPTLPQIGPQSA